MSTVDEDYEALIQFMYMAPVGLVQISAAGEISMINPLSAQLLLPLAPDGNLGNLFDALRNVAPDLQHLCDAFAPGHGMVCEALRLQVDAGERGKRDPQVLSLTLLKLDPQRLMAVLTDVSQQVRRERLLKQNEAWLSAILTGITDYALISLDAQGRIDGWNPSIGRVTGYDADAVAGAPYSIFYPADSTTADRLRDRLHEADANGWSMDDGWRRRADGSRFWGSAVIVPLQARSDSAQAAALHDGEPMYCLVLRDITDKREASESQRRATSCDHLTGIANRRAFFEAGELEIERFNRTPRPLSLVLFDADHFKAVNDTHGHAAGDAVLRHLAQTLASTFREVDVVARVGGEEFAVLLPSTGIDGARAVAERLRAAVAACPVPVDGVTIAYTVSAGVAAMAPGLGGLDALLKRADEALYAAKTGGRNRVVCAALPAAAIG